jgi:hypothetical protein
MIDRAPHKVTTPYGEVLPDSKGVWLGFLEDRDWNEFLEGRLTVRMARTVAELRKPIVVRRRRKR